MKRQFIAAIAALTLAATSVTTVFADDVPGGGDEPLPEIKDRLPADAHFELKNSTDHLLTMEYSVNEDFVQEMIKGLNLSSNNIVTSYFFQDGKKYLGDDNLNEYQVTFTDMNKTKLTNGHTYKVRHISQDQAKELEAPEAVAENNTLNVSLKVPEEFGSFVLVEDTTNIPVVTMYRAYNPNSGEHFYTKNKKEFDHIVSLGWHNEGVGWIAPEKSNHPVYRLYNKNGGEHHYTMNAKEKDALIKAGWKDEKIGWYSDDAESVALYRQYNPNAFSNNHNYTTAGHERSVLLKAGWRDENIGWYGVRVK